MGAWERWLTIGVPPPIANEAVEAAPEFNVVALSVPTVAEAELRDGVVMAVALSNAAVKVPLEWMSTATSGPVRVRPPEVNAAVVMLPVASAVVVTVDAVTAPPLLTVNCPPEPTDNMAVSDVFPTDTLPSGNTVRRGALPANRFTGVVLVEPKFTDPVPLESAVTVACTVA